MSMRESLAGLGRAQWGWLTAPSSRDRHRPGKEAGVGTRSQGQGLPLMGKCPDHKAGPPWVPGFGPAGFLA